MDLPWFGENGALENKQSKKQSNVFGRLAADVLTCSLSLSRILSFGPFGFSFSFFVFCCFLICLKQKRLFFKSDERQQSVTEKKKTENPETINVINFAPQQSKIYYCG